MDSQKLYITINGKKVSATLVNNSSTKALTEKLAAGHEPLKKLDK